MMLVQKPHNILFTTPAAYSHRRHPSAPVVVQPTRTPGLLSLSKPQQQQQPSKATPQRQLPSQQRRETKAGKTVEVVRAQTLAPTAEVGPQAPATPSPPSRGRAPPKHLKEKVQSQIPRSASHSSPRGTKHGRQPSPPLLSQPALLQPSAPSQAEEFSIIKSTNLFDPFSDDNAHPSPPPSPTISKPTGKLARRRQQIEPIPAPALSQAIPVPVTQRANINNISRSDPLPSHMRPRPIPKRTSTAQEFPICDDMSEIGERSYPLSPPSTPRKSVNSGPRTAPVMQVPPLDFPFGKTAGVEQSSTKKRRKHHRAPSEGVFSMSSDEEASIGLSGAALSANVQALFKMVNSAKRSSLPSTPAPVRSHGSSYGSDSEGSEKASYYASSMFQNSPSPEELPDPLLI